MPDTKKILKNVRKLELKTKHLVDGLLQGAYHSVFKGTGIEFSEVREYIPGDDIRAIDWKVTARMNQPFVKEFIEERDLTVYIALDISASGEFGSEKSKKDMNLEMAASLMFAALRNDDRVGLCLFTDEVERFIPPRKGKKHILKLLREMIEYGPRHRTTAIRPALTFLSRIAKKRSIMFLISDFFAELDFSKQLKILRGKHDVIAINVNDVREQEMPDVGYIELEDEETGEQILVDTSDWQFRKNYSELIRKKNEDIKKMLSRMNIDIIELKSNEPFDMPLRKFFRARQRRLR